MHALQALPLLARTLTLLPAAARLSSRTRVQIVLLVAAGYTGVVALTLWQALRGQPLTHPDATTVIVATALLVALACGVLALIHHPHRQTAGQNLPAQQAASSDAVGERSQAKRP